MTARWSDGQSFDTFHIPYKLHWCQIQNMHACIRHASTFFKSFVYKVHASLCVPQSLRNSAIAFKHTCITAMDTELETPQVINFFPTAGNFLSISAVKSTTCITVLHWHGTRHPELTEGIVGIWNKHRGYLDVHWAFFVLIFFFCVCGVVWWWLGRYKEPNGDWSIQFVEIVIAWFLMCQEILWKTNDTFNAWQMIRRTKFRYFLHTT